MIQTNNYLKQTVKYSVVCHVAVVCLVIILGSGTVVALSLLAVLSVGCVHWPVQMLDTVVWRAGVTYATEKNQLSNPGMSIHPGTSTCTDKYVLVLFLCTDKMSLAAAINYFSILLNKRLPSIFLPAYGFQSCGFLPDCTLDIKSPIWIDFVKQCFQHGY